MKCSKTCQNDVKTCQNECEYYSEAEFDSEMPSKPCFITVLMILGLSFCISALLILLPEPEVPNQMVVCCECEVANNLGHLVTSILLQRPRKLPAIFPVSS